MNNDAEAKDENLGPLLEHFAERLNRVFAYDCCVFEFRDDPNLGGDPATSGRAWSLQTIKNACLHETLAAIRDIDDFLSQRTKSRPDDMRASDFGYMINGGFLSPPEREAIHKLVVHTTTTGAAKEGFRWDVWDLTTRCVARSTDFLEWVENNYCGFRLWTTARCCRDRTRKVYEWVARDVAARQPPIP
jgi:hypothetical protein